MKLRILVIIGILLFSGISPVYAQELNIPKAESDYRYQFDQYRTAYQTYLVNRNEYFNNSNLKTQQDALDSAKIVALARNDVLRSFGQWLRLQLLQYGPSYPQAITISNLLDGQNNWYLSNKDKISAAGNTDVFEKVMTDYKNLQPTRDKLYLQAQIELKLSWLNAQLINSTTIFSPIATKLQDKTNIPEVEQGLAKIKALQDQTKTQIAAASKLASGIDTDGRPMETSEINRRGTQALDSVRSSLVSMVALMKELETRYAH